MTWDHPRAYRPLDKFGRHEIGRHIPSPVEWDRQPLAAFEARPIAELAERYDLLVIDHPGLGAAVSSGALLPLESLLDSALLCSLQAGSVGRTWPSYRLAGRQWAVPIDAATQVTVYRPDRVDTVPSSWQAVPEFAREVPTTLCLGGPHALLTVLGMCASAENRSDADADAELLPRDSAADAIELLREAYAHSNQALSVGNPIEIHEALAARADVWFCPLAYGYAGYARPRAGRAALRWTDAPGFGAHRPGGVLGGTGLAVSAHSADRVEELRAWIRAFLDPEVQAGLVPDAGGQPAAAAAWDAAAVDSDWGGFYSATRRSIEQAYLRPRFAGWITLQEEASALIRAAITDRRQASHVIGRINDRYRAARSAPSSVGAAR